MNVLMLGEARAELTEAFEHYEKERAGLGVEFVTEFRRGIDRIIQYPGAWNALDEVYRRCVSIDFRMGLSTVSMRRQVKFWWRR